MRGSTRTGGATPRSGASASPAGGRRPAAAAAHRIRIIGGTWKRTPLPVPDLPGLRPTPDRVRETLFNWLGPVTGLRCLDLFAGTGALGLEAASRGAAEVWLVEPEPRAQRALRGTLDKLSADQVTLLASDALAALARAAREGRRFDLVLLDPPFGEGWLERVLPRLAPLLADQAALYIETGEPLSDAQLGLLQDPGFRITRQGRAGQVFYHLVLRQTSQESA